MLADVPERIVAMAVAGTVVAQTPRSVELLPAHASGDGRFDPAQSAALFIGVRHFTHDESLAEVPYAVDDAVDFAFAFTLDRAVHLVSAGRVVLALSVAPQKTESQQKLDALRAAGASVREAGESDILSLLDRQARSVGKEGVFLLGVATHGFNAGGVHCLLAASSLLDHHETAISTDTMLDIIRRSEAPRALLFLDSCRTRLARARGEGEADRRSVAPLIRAVGEARGEAVFYAAAAGQYAYDDDELKNGVFTAAVVDGIRCAAAADARGLITVDTLADYVNVRVLTWVRKAPRSIRGARHSGHERWGTEGDAARRLFCEVADRVPQPGYRPRD